MVDQGSAYCELFSEFPIRTRQHYKSEGWTWIARFPSKTRRGKGGLDKGHLGTTNEARKNVGFIMHVLECLASPNKRSLRRTKGILQPPNANRAGAARNELAWHLTGLTSGKGIYPPHIETPIPALASALVLYKPQLPFSVVTSYDPVPFYTFFIPTFCVLSS